MNYLCLLLLPAHPLTWIPENASLDFKAICFLIWRVAIRRELLIHTLNGLRVSSHTFIPLAFFEVVWYHSTPTVGLECIYFQENQFFGVNILSFSPLLSRIYISMCVLSKFRRIYPQQKSRLFSLGWLEQKVYAKNILKLPIIEEQ